MTPDQKRVGPRDALPTNQDTEPLKPALDRRRAAAGVLLSANRQIDVVNNRGP
jgi:hypothetical protein